MVEEKIKWFLWRLDQPVDQNTGFYILFGLMFLMTVTFIVMAEWGKRKRKEGHSHSH